MNLPLRSGRRRVADSATIPRTAQEAMAGDRFIDTLMACSSSMNESIFITRSSGLGTERRPLLSQDVTLPGHPLQLSLQVADLGTLLSRRCTSGFFAGLADPAAERGIVDPQLLGRAFVI